MGTYSQILYQIVFSTKNRDKTLDMSIRDDLFKYFSGVITNNKCHLYQIGGISDHVHILLHLHPTTSLSNLVKDIKLASSDFIKRTELIPHFTGWQDGYGAFTYHIKDKIRLIDYIKTQEIHHYTKPFKDEYIELLNEHGILFDEKYLF